MLFEFKNGFYGSLIAYPTHNNYKTNKIQEKSIFDKKDIFSHFSRFLTLFWPKNGPKCPENSFYMSPITYHIYQNNKNG